MNPRDSAFQHILDTVTYILDEYQKSCASWKKRSTEQVNFKKKIVSDIQLDGNIYKHIINYLRYIERSSLLISLTLIPTFACRVKNKASLDSKIERYKGEERYKFGKVPINKCLNDIFGARIIIDYPLSFFEIKDYLQNNFPQWKNLKVTDSSKDEYKATHIYFKCDSSCLLWELQIWFLDDEKSNRDSHQKYKQGYAQWEQSLREEEL